MIQSESESFIISGLTSLGIRFSPSNIRLLASYIEEIEKWNKKINLVKASGKKLIIRHLFDCLAGLPFFQNTTKKRTILDIGSGAGFPGIPLSVFMPGSVFFLAERSGKKAGFLRNCVLVPGFPNIEIIEDDVNNIDRKVDIITFRAFSVIAKICKTASRLLHLGGRIIAYKGRMQKIEEELSWLDPGEFTVNIKKVDVPFLDEERHLVILELVC